MRATLSLSIKRPSGPDGSYPPLERLAVQDGGPARVQVCLVVMQQVGAIGAPSIHAAVISDAPLLLTHCVASIRVRVDRSIENGIAVATPLVPTMFKFRATDVIAIGRSIHALFRSSASSN